MFVYTYSSIILGLGYPEWSFFFIFISKKEVKRCVEEVGVGFMMAPIYHPAMKTVSPVRKKLKVKTVFNILGPMLNPARVPFAVVGVYHEDLVSAFYLNSSLN